jgi:hypothetical protein
MHAPSTERQLAGVIGFYDDPTSLISATAKVRDARYHRFDAFTPFPVHGLEAAQGLKRSPLPFVTFIAGLTGFSLAFLFQYWTSAVDWPLIIGGKPFNSWPAFVPIMFELTVLFAALSTVGAMFAFNGLPNLKRKAFDPSLTRDKFALLIEAPTPVDQEDEDAVERQKRQLKGYKEFSEAEVAQFLKAAGAREVRSVYVEGWF